MSDGPIKQKNEKMNSLPGIKVQKTIIIHKPAKLRSILDESTIVIIGSQRGNTSAVAYTLYNMGLFLGERIGEKNYEDMDILDLLPDPSLKSRFDEIKFAKFVSNRNNKYSRWSFKIPHASGYVDELAHTLRNPIFIVVFRNSAGVMRSISNRESKRVSIERMLSVASQPLQAATHVNRIGAPMIMVDSDAVTRQPKIFIEEISDILNLTADERLVEALTQSGYKISKPRDGMIFVPQ